MPRKPTYTVQVKRDGVWRNVKGMKGLPKENINAASDKAFKAYQKIGLETRVVEDREIPWTHR